MSVVRKTGTQTFILLAGTLLAVLLAVSCLAGLGALYREELRLGRDNLRRLSLALAEQTALAFQEIDGVLVKTRPLLVPTGGNPPEDAALHELLRQRFQGLLQGQALLVFGPEGRLRGHSREYPTPDIQVADREYFRTHLGPDDDHLYISSPLRNRVNNRWMISLSRRLSGPDGSFAGVIMAAVELEYFLRLYQALNLPRQARLSLLRDDGTVLAIYPFDEAALGRGQPASDATGDTIEASSPVSGLPMTIRLTQPRKAILAHWYGLLWTLGPGALVAVLGIVALTWALLVRVRSDWRRAQEQQRLLEDQVRQRTHDLREVLDFNAMILAVSPVAIAVFGETGQCVTANDVFCRMAGADTATLLTGPIESVPSWRQGDLADKARHVLETGETAQGEAWLEPQSGDGLWVAWQCVRFWRKKSPQLLFLATDISGRRQVEEEVRRMGALLTSMLRNLPLDFWARDRQSRLIIQSDISREYWGDLCATPTCLAAVPQDVADIWSDNNLRALAGEVVTQERIYTLPSGRTIYVQERIAPIREDGAITGTMGVNVDLTPRRLLEIELRAAKEAAESANRSKSDFLANMSHEIRTPLNGILGMLQLLEATSLDEEQQEYLQAAILSTKRLTRLLSDILDLSRVEAGKLSLIAAPFDLEALRTSILDIFYLQARGKGLELAFHIDPGVPRHLIGDEVRLRQILMNLVGNAIKFTVSGQVRVEIVPLPYATEHRMRLHISVEDTGPGIADELLATIFRPFVQGGFGELRAHQGAGLGLAIVRRLVHLMDGELAVDNHEGGTTIHLSLPFGQANPPEIADQALRAQEPSPAATDCAILLVEDESVNRLAVRRMLEKAGHAVTVAANGQEALERVVETAFDLILMDIQMPVMDGLTASRGVRQIEAQQKRSPAPIVAMTAYAMTGDRESFLAAGLDDYLAKPLERDVLLRRIGQLASRCAVREAKA